MESQKSVYKYHIVYIVEIFTVFQAYWQIRNNALGNIHFDCLAHPINSYALPDKLLPPKALTCFSL